MRACISRLSAVNQCLSESPDLATVLREALKLLGQRVRQFPLLGVKQMPPFG